jgi:acyl-CoA reductase-like NAD-dependent aldehyde dehydrogenase
MAPAMAAGNTFVLKSSEKSPLALAAYGDLLNEVSDISDLPVSHFPPNKTKETHKVS